MRKRQPLRWNFVRVRSSLMLVASSNDSPDFLGAATKRMNSRDLLQRYLSPRHSISFSPLVDQLATDVNTAAGRGRRLVFQRSVTIGCRVGSHFKRCLGTGNAWRPTFSPKVK